MVAPLTKVEPSPSPSRICGRDAPSMHRGARQRANDLCRWLVVYVVALAPRLYLLARYELELSEDGFAAVKTVHILQTQGFAALPTNLVDRFLLHPLYMSLLGALRLVVPSSADFFVPARLLSVLIASIAVVLMFECVRRSFGELAGWIAALLLSFVPTFLWESISIISSALFLSLYLAVWLALLQERYRVAALLGYLAAMTRYEGLVLIALIALFLLVRDLRRHSFVARDWLAVLGSACAFALSLLALGWLWEGNPLQAFQANAMAAVWLRTLAPADWVGRAQYFIMGYPKLFPLALIWIGIAGAVLAVSRHRGRATLLLLVTFVVYVLFDETLVWFDLTTLEERFLLYPALPFLAFAGLGIAEAYRLAMRLGRAPWSAGPGLSDRRADSGEPGATKPLRRAPSRLVTCAAASLALVILLASFSKESWQRANAGMLWIHGNHASQEEVADQLAAVIPAHQPARIVVYAGTSNVLEHFARQRGLDLHMSFFRFIPEDGAEQFLLDSGVEYVLFPRGNGFARAKYPYLDQSERQPHAAVTFVPIVQFTTASNDQEHILFACQPQPNG